jgi:eukaryotic-like serine/threonine-protein kinase
MHNKVLFLLLSMIILSYIFPLTISSRTLFHILLTVAKAQEASGKQTINDNIKNNNANLTFGTFENSTYGIKMLYPSNWNKEQNISDGGSISNSSKLSDIVRFSPPFENNNSDKSAENFDIKVDNISDVRPITLAKYTNDTIEDLGKDFKIISLDKNTTMSGGNPAYKLEYTGVEQDVNLNALMVFTMKGDKAYIITYTAEPSRYSSDLPVVQKMVNSIEITK